MGKDDDDSFEAAVAGLDESTRTGAGAGAGVARAVSIPRFRFRFYSVPPPELFHRFSRQRDAFIFFDALPGHDRRNIKLFQCELPHTGKREFVVCSARKYYEIFHAIGAVDKAKRHHYEIIRDGFPCRAYFDLEFAKAANPGADGEALTAHWLQCFSWKVLAVYGVPLQKEDFIVLDSSTKDKFSKHVIVRIPASAASVQRGGNTYTAEEVGRGLVQHKECLFVNNMVLGRFVEALVGDMLQHPLGPGPGSGAAAGDNNNNNSNNNSAEDSRGGTGGFPVGSPVPKGPYADFWVWAKDGLTKTCFVDLGVYTRNRLFRLYGSCKFGKAKGLMLAMQDKKLYWANTDIVSAEAGAGIASSSGGGAEAADLKQRKLIAERILQASFVVPMDLFLHAPLQQAKEHPVAQAHHRPKMSGMMSTKKSSAQSAPAIISSPSPRSSSSPGSGSGAYITQQSPRDSDDALNQAVYDIDVPLEFITSGGESAAAAANCAASITPPPVKRQKTDNSNINTNTNTNSNSKNNIESPTEAEQAENVHPLTFNAEYRALSLHASRAGVVGAIGTFPHNDAVTRESREHGSGEDGDEGEEMNARRKPLESKSHIDYCGVAALSMQVMNPISCAGMVAGAAQLPDGMSGTSGGSGLAGAQGAERVLGVTNAVANKDWTDRELAQSVKYGQKSPFPDIDKFILAFVNRDSGSRGGHINSWKVYGAASVYLPEGSGPAVKVRYQIGGNRWCANIGRQHKSNQIILECDLHLARFQMVQSCWDPECKGFRSQPISIPPICKTDALLSQFKEFQGLFLDRCVLALAEDY